MQNRTIRNWEFGLLALLSLMLVSSARGLAAPAAPPAQAVYVGVPQFEPVSGTALSYAGNSPQEIIHATNVYYLRDQRSWFISSNPQGPWQPIHGVPREVDRVSCTRIGDTNSPFAGDYQLCVGPLPKVKLTAFWHT